MATPSKQDTVVKGAYNLQQQLIRNGYYNKDASQANKSLRLAYWLVHNLQTYHTYRIWCPDSNISVEG